MSVVVIGAGMAGLLAANMLRNHEVTVIEAQSSLPNNHSAVLRFRSGVVGDVLGLPFKEVQALRATASIGNPIADALAYSHKSTGKATLRSIARVGEVPVTRYIAPPMLISTMAKGLDIQYNSSITRDDLIGWNDDNVKVISTIPMPIMMDILGYPYRPKFPSREGFNIVVPLHRTDAYVSLYVPNPALQFHRVSITGGELIIEYAAKSENVNANTEIDRALKLLGLPLTHASRVEAEIRPQRYAKILPIDDSERKQFIQHLTDYLGVYSLGRFACWRPGLLLDDVVSDVRSIERMWNETPYDWRK